MPLKDIQGIVLFIQRNWVPFLIAALLIAPIIWVVASKHFEERIMILEEQIKLVSEKLENANSRITDLESRVKILDELKNRSLTDINVTFSPTDLYTISQP